ncbi:MAG: YjgB family protein [Bacillota bacterium]|jgi:hypothetical protein
MQFKRNFLIICLIMILLLSLTACSGTSSPPKKDTPGGISEENENIPQPDGEQEEQENQEKQEEKEFIVQVMDLAKQGKVIGCDFIAGKTVFDDVEKEWGKADKTDYVAEAKGTYATYSSKGFVFGINKGSQVFEIREIGNLENITFPQVKEVLGNPDKVLDYPGQDILGYTTGTEYKLEFVFPEPTADNPDPVLDHLNVLYPPGTVNMMADDPGREW